MSSARDKKILIVEDEAQLLEILSERLRKEGFQIFAARDGKEGLERALGERPDLILLDIIMPNMDGLTMLKLLREDPWGKSVAVILLSNLGPEETIAQALEKGAVDYLVKADWSMDDAIARIKARLECD